MADLLGGSIEVDSEIGKGSRFTINLAIWQEETAKLEASESAYHLAMMAKSKETQVSPDASMPRGVILLAEDNLANILTIGEYLESHGYQVVVAHDGMEAIEQAEAIPPDIILMDVQMPVLNGLEAMARLRQNPRFGNTPIIALTALAMAGDRERCIQAGRRQNI